MTPLALLVMLLLAAIATLASYIRRVYAEYGKILAHEVQDNLDAWEEQVEPRLGLGREHAALCAAVLEQFTIALIALWIGAILFYGAPDVGRPTPLEIFQAILAVVLVVVFTGQLIPSLLFYRTRGLWAARLLWPIRILMWIATPITGLLRFSLSVADLAEAPTGPEGEEPAPDVEALIEAGEEEGILEQSDSALVRSAVEFGDKLVREVMTPRPSVFAVAGSIPLESFLELLREHNYSRVPVYDGTFDQVTGIAFAHDMLHLSDEEARTRTVAEIQRPAAFVPETKRGYELLREMQREKQHMRIVIDEYGAVAGLVTIEDLLEEIVGSISDEHEGDGNAEEPQREPSGSWLVPASFPAGQLSDLFGEPVEMGEDYEAATLGGLASEIEGHIPQAGETIVIPGAEVRMEVVAATTQRVERLRLFPHATKLPFPPGA
jgi:putative hemolysin